MSQRNTLIRSLHDIGIAAWFGGGLMGAVGVNGAAASAKDPSERVKIAAVGWGKWAPVQLAAIAAHGVGGLGLIYANKSRLATQKEGRTNTVVKVVITLAALAVTGWSGILGKQMADHSGERVEGATEPSSSTSDKLAAIQKQQRILQWAIPVLTSVLIVLGAQQGEQQRPFAGLLGR